MKKLVLLALIAACVISAPFAAKHGKGRKALAAPAITITPDVLAAVGPAPTVCVDGFVAGTYVNVEVPSFSYGFMINVAGKQCHTPEYELSLLPGIYDVSSLVCNYVPPSTLTNCAAGPVTTLTVQ